MVIFWLTVLGVAAIAAISALPVPRSPAVRGVIFVVGALVLAGCVVLALRHRPAAAPVARPTVEALGGIVPLHELAGRSLPPGTPVVPF